MAELCLVRRCREALNTMPTAVREEAAFSWQGGREVASLPTTSMPGNSQENAMLRLSVYAYIDPLII